MIMKENFNNQKGEQKKHNRYFEKDTCFLTGKKKREKITILV